MLAISYVTVYWALSVILLVLLDRHRITRKQWNGWSAILCTTAGVVSAVNGWTVSVYLNAALTAWCAYDWWHRGGGDGTKRRLKRWAGRFQGVRRTAPQGAS